MDWRTVVMCGQKYMTIGSVDYYIVFGRTVRLQTLNGQVIVLD
jgi:hypothetical protein